MGPAVLRICFRDETTAGLPAAHFFALLIFIGLSSFCMFSRMHWDEVSVKRNFWVVGYGGGGLFLFIVYWL